ncbi:hypothetical protein L249_0269 [Ophiocordyceps polyrhachis-furcata BCC 54312]|uniref:Meiotic expression up-regulated protein 6 PH domain-containing protein n=1 Tax=Ophiocordyceps polyrhachis-furcata BCC 54312 TaxID=1330021 RepID=A0A367LEX9_9HYPO|nr:hypothetical protein L249_0269 [Ophiocordyceps polyrhachis-furcata BCC 54312]
MAEEQKPIVDAPEVVKPEAPVVDQPTVSETAPVATESKIAHETKPAEAAAEGAVEAPKTDVKKDDVKPVEEGHLAHKAQGASFPKNLIPSKEFFFFGSDAVEPKHLASYQKAEKSADVAHDNIAWASHTGKGLLFLGDKKAPHGVINLAHASDPEVDGSHKFHFTSKGLKHSFKANTTPERDSWVAQLKLKIAEAKDLVSSVTESEAYKKTHETFKPVPVPAAAALAKDDKPTEDAAKTDEPVKADETPKEGEAVKEDVKDEEPKRRSASRKRASFFAFGSGKKDDKREQKEEKKDESSKAEAAPAVAAAAAEPAVEAEETPAAEAATEDVAPAESPKERSAHPKRNSFFGGVFSKKEKKPADSKAVDEAPEAAPEAELPTTTTDATAPVIPPVESTTPLAVDVPTTTAAPAEAAETTAANPEVKKDTKEKRKSSLPFAFGKRDKSPVPAEGEDKAGMSAFSKLRATIKGKSAAKPEDKVTEEAAKEEATAAAATTDAKKDASAEAAQDAPSAAPEASAPEAENKPENVASATPAVTAAA